MTVKMTVNWVRNSILALLAVLLSACGSGGSDSDNSGDGGFSTGGGSTAREAIDSYVNDFIIPLYANLDSSAAALNSAAKALAANTNETNLVAARSAWVAARISWEKSETSLFGPVDFYGFDPAMDSWPVNRTDLDAVLLSNVALTRETVRNLDNSLKGFHTIEYLLWGQSSTKAASSITAREKEYLTALTAELNGTTGALLAAWTTGINGQSAYALELTKAGQGSSSFPTEQTAIEQFVRGMLGICDEVANGKIADPFDTRNPNIVESQFSFNSISDFSNNIRGAKEAYTKSVAGLVAAKNAGLDATTRAQFDAAVAAILQIPEPFRDAILDSSNDATIKAAQQAIRQLGDTLQSRVLPAAIS